MEGRLDPQHSSRKQGSKCSLGTSRDLETEGERGDMEEETGRQGRWRERPGEAEWSGGAGRGEGLTRSWENGLGRERGAPSCEEAGVLASRPDWVFFNANSMLFTFHLNLRCCYKLSTSSLFLRGL